MNLQQEQAQLLIECLPYIKHFFGETVVIKYGGHAMENEALKQAFAKNIALLRYVGIKPVIVHGGGPQIGSLLERLGIKSTFREGQRVTDDATMEAVEMVLVGQVNNEIVNLLNLAGVRAVGLSGKDAHSLRAEKLRLYAKAEQGGTTPQNAPTAPVSMNATQNGSPAPASPDSLGSVVKAMPQLVDLGKVGEVSSVDTSLIQALSGAGFIPVIAPVGVDEAGNTYNINADSVAGAVAGALKAKRLLLLTDVAGVLDADKKLIRSITVDKAAGLFEDGTLKGGMIPKIRCCLEALAAGVEKAMVIDGRVENCILLELFTDSGIGTEIVH